uniref:Gnk2-homologous domain-containing protein n=1 Tax=Brassica oleracea var. oleracea TaxID=109376 RepID=A0A0D3BKR1_BRAOL
MYISLDIRTGFFGYLFGFFGFFRIFGLPVRVRLITLRVRICFVPPYEIHSGIFYISDRVRIGFFGSGLVRISDYGFYAQAYCLVSKDILKHCLVESDVDFVWWRLSWRFVCFWCHWCALVADVLGEVLPRSGRLKPRLRGSLVKVVSLKRSVKIAAVEDSVLRCTGWLMGMHVMFNLSNGTTTLWRHIKHCSKTPASGSTPGGDSEDEEEEEEKEKEGEKEGGRKKKKNFLDEEADEVPIAGEADTYEFDPVQGSFTANNTFAKNLNSLVSSLSSLTPKVYGFYSLTSGNSSGEPAYAIALCKREVKRHDCLRCIQTAARNITELYPGKKEDIVWYTHCMFRYSNRVIYGKKETDPTQGFIASEKISADRVEFQRLLRGLFDRLKGIAAAGGSNRKYAQGNGSASTGYRRFYGMAQCTPDLSEQDFNDCLDFGFQSMSICCDDVVATDTYSQENELGRGGFGSVYKGMFSDGQEIAVKRLSNTSGEGDIEFKNEIMLLAKLRHRNLVRLLGFCIKGEERLLFYEFIKNASLDRFIFGNLFQQFFPHTTFSSAVC